MTPPAGTTSPTAADQADRPGRSGPAHQGPSLSTSTSVVAYGQLVWIGWLWFTILVLLVLGLGAMALTGRELAESAWAPFGAGWQRWVLFGAGAFSFPTFLRMFVSHGVTRAQLSRSILVALPFLACLGAAVVSAGFAIERAFFVNQGWVQAMPDGHGPFTYGELPRLALDHGLLLMAYFLAGWLVGATWLRRARPGSLLLLVPALLTIAACELLVGPQVGGANISVFRDAMADPHLAVTVLGCSVVIAAASILATRVTRVLPVP